VVEQRIVEKSSMSAERAKIIILVIEVGRRGIVTSLGSTTIHIQGLSLTSEGSSVRNILSGERWNCLIPRIQGIVWIGWLGEY
jgi:hypothetical protein